MTRTGEPLDESGTTDNRNPQADEVRGVVIEREGVGGEQHRTRDHGNRELRDDVHHEATMRGVLAGACRADTLHRRHDHDRARQHEAERAEQSALRVQR